MSSNINFKCNKCGGCCNQAPKVNFYEMIEMQEDFIWQACHNILISTTNNPIDKTKAEQLHTIGHTIVVPEHELSLFYYIDFQPIETIINNKCPKLSQENMCSIYGRRPTRCRLSPFSILDNEASQIKNINIFKDNVAKSLWNCSFDSKDYPLYSDFGFKQASHKSLFYQEMHQTRDITDKFIDFLELQDENTKQKHFESLFDYSVNKKFNTVFSDLEFIFHMSLYFNLISDFSINEFISKQQSLLNERINLVIDKETNNKYKLLNERYSYFLNNDYFSNLYNLR